MMTLKKASLAACLSLTIAVMGCSSLQGGTEEQVQDSYTTFLENKPSFETQKIGIAGVDGLYASIARLCELQYEDLKAIDELTTNNLDGYKIFTTIAKLEKEENGAAKVQDYLGKLTDAEKKAFALYGEQAKAVTDRTSARYEEILKLATNVYAVKDLDVIAKASMIDKARMLIPVGAAIEQINYAVNSAKWFKVFEATLKNAEGEQGR